VNSDDAACATLDDLRGSIRKRDKRIGGFGHEQSLRIGAWPRYGIAAELLLLAIWPGRRRSRRFRSPVTNRQAEIMMRIAFEFGFTPASRSRIFSYSQKNLMLLEIVDKPYDESSGW
jgi:hypothetical protein